MVGRVLGLVAALAVASVGLAEIASRTAAGDTAKPALASAGAEDGGSRQGSGFSTSLQRRSGGEVRLGRAQDSHFYADTEVDGTPIRMLVDSGASIVALTRRDALAMGIDVDRLPEGGLARTAGGTVPLRPVMLDRIEIDGIEVRRVQAAVLDADIGVSLLGQSFLSRLDAVNVEGDTMTLR